MATARESFVPEEPPAPGTVIRFSTYNSRGAVLAVATLVATPDQEGDGSVVLCKSCWQSSIVEERRTKVSRLVNYRRRHPKGATRQCGGKTWW